MADDVKVAAPAPAPAPAKPTSAVDAEKDAVAKAASGAVALAEKKAGGFFKRNKDALIGAVVGIACLVVLGFILFA